jgi:hypothetical protein
MKLARLELAIAYKQKTVRSLFLIHSLRGLIWGNLNDSAVRGPSKHPATVGRHLVRRIARIPAEESDPEAGGSVSDRLVVPHLLPAVHSDTRKFDFAAHEEAFHEILDPRIVLLVLLA